MSAAFLGRGLVLAGIVAGLLAVSLPFADETRYVDDGTVAAFLIVLLSLTSLLPAEIGRDLPGRVRRLGRVRVLPVRPGGLRLRQPRPPRSRRLARPVHRPDPDRRPGRVRGRSGDGEAPRIDRGPGLLAGTVGLVLVAVGIWLDFSRDGPTYWNVSSSGHALGLLLIVLVVADALLLAAAAHSSLHGSPAPRCWPPR